MIKCGATLTSPIIWIRLSMPVGSDSDHWPLLAAGGAVAPSNSRTFGCAPTSGDLCCCLYSQLSVVLRVIIPDKPKSFFNRDIKNSTWWCKFGRVGVSNLSKCSRIRLPPKISLSKSKEYANVFLICCISDTEITFLTKNVFFLYLYCRLD